MTLYYIYPALLLIHIISVIVWLGFFPVEISLIYTIKKESDERIKEVLIQKLLSLTNLTGMIGSVGIIFTGILMVIISPFYNFFEFKANHWLTTKQFIIIIILIIIFFAIIPISKKIKVSYNPDGKDFKNFIKWAYIEKFLVIINFLLAFLHRYYF